jgi:hypothetical protein
MAISQAVGINSCADNRDMLAAGSETKTFEFNQGMQVVGWKPRCNKYLKVMTTTANPHGTMTATAPSAAHLKVSQGIMTSQAIMKRVLHANRDKENDMDAVLGMTLVSDRVDPNTEPHLVTSDFFLELINSQVDNVLTLPLP